MQVLLRRTGCCGCHCFRENDIYSLSLLSLTVKKQKTDGNVKVSQVEAARCMYIVYYYIIICILFKSISCMPFVFQTYCPCWSIGLCCSYFVLTSQLRWCRVPPGQCTDWYSKTLKFFYLSAFFKRFQIYTSSLKCRIPRKKRMKSRIHDVSHGVIQKQKTQVKD